MIEQDHFAALNLDVANALIQDVVLREALGHLLLFLEGRGADALALDLELIEVECELSFMSDSASQLEFDDRVIQPTQAEVFGVMTWIQH